MKKTKMEMARKAGKSKGKQPPELAQGQLSEASCADSEVTQNTKHHGIGDEFERAEASTLIHYRLCMMPRDRTTPSTLAYHPLLVLKHCIDIFDVKMEEKHFSRNHMSYRSVYEYQGWWGPWSKHKCGMCFLNSPQKGDPHGFPRSHMGIVSNHGSDLKEMGKKGFEGAQSNSREEQSEGIILMYTENLALHKGCYVLDNLLTVTCLLSYPLLEPDPEKLAKSDVNIQAYTPASLYLKFIQGSPHLAFVGDPRETVVHQELPN
ncbi:hypothetical protein STEG23_032902 [Scotinomys teguina]